MFKFLHIKTDFFNKKKIKTQEYALGDGATI